MPPVASPDTTCWMKMSTTLVPQVRAADRVVLAKDLGRPLQHDASRLEQEHVVGEVEGHGGVLLHEQDGHALPVHGAEDPEDLAHDHRGQAERRLVEQQESRPEHKVPRPSGAWAMPSCTTSSVPRRSSGSPWKRIAPVVRTMREIARSVVVLPAPFAPRMVVIPPDVMEKVTPCR